jgi:ribA/ribD-fused uncharacterized protein
MTMKQFKEQNFLEKYNQYVFFYNGYLSNWADTPFLDTRTGTPYNCSEQYMMEKKALLFGDYDIAKKIMTKDFPGDQKALGRLVKNFNKKVWDEHARQIVYEGCYYKFTQNKDAYNYLMESKGYYLVEASPTDTVWGVGLGGYDKLIEDPKNWQGTNWLGQVLTQLREDLEETPDAVLF